MNFTAANIHKLGMFNRAANVRGGAINGLGAPVREVSFEPETVYGANYARPASKLTEDDDVQTMQASDVLKVPPLFAATDPSEWALPDFKSNSLTAWANPLGARGNGIPSVSPWILVGGAAVVAGVIWMVLKK